MSHYYVIQLKANFVFSTLFNTKHVELYFSYFFLQFYMIIHAYGKITRCFEVFCIPIWNK